MTKQQPKRPKELTAAFDSLPLLLQCEANLDGYLPVGDLAFLDVATRFHHLKPLHIADGLAGRGNGRVDGIFYARRRGAGEFDDFVYVL